MTPQPQHPAPAERAETNQCDGCRRGLPVDEHGIHRGEGLSDTMYCEKERYAPPPPAEQPTWWVYQHGHAIADALESGDAARRNLDSAEQGYYYQSQRADAAERRVGELEKALQQCVSVIDGLLGDSDLPDDDRPGVVAMQVARALLSAPQAQ